MSMTACSTIIACCELPDRNERHTLSLPETGTTHVEAVSSRHTGCVQDCDEKLRKDYFEARIVPLKVAAARDAEARKAAVETDFRSPTRPCPALLAAPALSPLVCLLSALCTPLVSPQAAPWARLPLLAQSW